MRRNRLGGWSLRHLRWGLAAFFLGLALPAAALIYHAFGQLKWEAFHQHRLLAEELAQRIDGEYRRMIAKEEGRPFTDYAFLNVAGSSEGGFLQRSPLSALNPDSAIPGLIGYFQVDGQGRLTTPLLPGDAATAVSYGIASEERQARQAKQQKIAEILSQNRLLNVRRTELGKTKARHKPEKQRKIVAEETDVALYEAEVPVQANFDKLAAAPSVAEEPTKYDSSRLFADKKRVARKEQARLPAPAVTAPLRQSLGESAGIAEEKLQQNIAELRISTFESQIDPLEISLLDSGQFVLFRKVWRDGERQIQGLLLDPQAFAGDIVRTAFYATSLAGISDLALSYRGQNLLTLSGHALRYSLNSAEELRGELLYQTALSAPLGDMELSFRIARLPIGPGGQVLIWNAVILAAVLLIGFYLMYRLGWAQIRLARQQQDFVSAVSHELKTPLTSIRMYGEMLREGWVNEEKKPRYYDYIFDESERLSRLINNVLQLARMTRSELPVNVQKLSVAECMALIRAKVGVQIERAGFAAVFKDAASDTVQLQLDPDHFSQIMINLVDNALKFSAKQSVKRIEIGCEVLRDKTVQFSVRDYGPGIAKNQMQKIFKLFYRSENELTRETVGTGIGLALVHQLAKLMGGRVDVLNKQPGAEFRVYFPLCRGR